VLGSLECEWPAYRLVDAGWCKLVDLDSLTLDDILDANDVLDAIVEARKD
jgi:hypothetical protein